MSKRAVYTVLAVSIRRLHAVFQNRASVAGPVDKCKKDCGLDVTQILNTQATKARFVYYDENDVKQATVTFDDTEANFNKILLRPGSKTYILIHGFYDGPYDDSEWILLCVRSH